MFTKAVVERVASVHHWCALTAGRTRARVFEAWCEDVMREGERQTLLKIFYSLSFKKDG